MLGVPLIDWALVAISLTNVVLLFWLGLTVLLNAERRSWGVAVVAFGLITGGLFFVSHTIILAQGLMTLIGGMDLWWHVGLGTVISLPLAWYIVVLWYSGYWEHRDSALRRRHRYGLALGVLLTGVTWVLLLTANPFPSYDRASMLELVEVPSLFGAPLLVLVYPVCAALSNLLALDALRHPAPPRRMMGEIARARALPWLLATSGALLLAAALVFYVMMRVVRSAQRLPDGAALNLYQEIALRVAYSDLAIACLITLAILFLGQAIVRYEVFTGKTLPQRRLFRHWRSVIILAFGFSTVTSAALQVNWLPPIYLVLLVALLLTAFYALFSRSSYVERERYFRHLRPFLSGERLYDHLTTGGLPSRFDVSTPFYALCDEVIGARVAYLSAVGAFAPLIGAPLSYPAQISPPNLTLDTLLARFTSPRTLIAPVDPAECSGASWAIPLWSERGLIGVLLLGEKRNGGLYTQEEIEIARATGERLIDTQASAEIAGRLMDLQRRRLAQNQVIDRRTRRVLHDDVLPRLHAAMLTLSMNADHEDIVTQLGDTHRQISDLLHALPAEGAPEVGRIGLIAALQRVVNRELGGAFDGVTWDIDPSAEAYTAAMPVLESEVIYYAAREAIRNAAVYGRGSDAKRPLHLCVNITCDEGFTVSIEDDGVGVSRTHDAWAKNGGAGQGLALHSTMMAVIGGALTVESLPDRFTRVRLSLPQAAVQAGD